MTDQSNALATREPAAVPQGLIHSPQALTTQLAALAQRYNVLSPAISISEFAPGYGANLAVVKIDTAVDMKKYGRGTDTYHSASLKMGADERALSKHGLLKIAQAAGIQWDPRECRRVDDGKTSNYWHWKYFGWVRTHDGQLMPVPGSRELDLRDGSPESRKMASDAQLQAARAAGNELCETKAMLRAIRTLGIRQVYNLEELSKPFVVVRFSFVPDMNDPEIKKLVTERALFGTGALYPVAASLAPALPPATSAAVETPVVQDRPAETLARPVVKVHNDMEAGLYDVTLEGGETFPTKSQEIANAALAAKKSATPVRLALDGQGFIASITPLETATPATNNTAPIVDELRVTDVNVQRGTNKTSGKPWTLYNVTLSNGVIASTFSESMHRVIDEAKKHNLPVTVSTSENERYPDKANLDSLTIVDTRQGTLPIAGNGGKY